MVDVTIPRQKHVTDLLFVMRPALMPPVWTIYLLAAGGQGDQIPAILSSGVIPGFLVLTALFGAIYVLNQYFDIESDRANQKLHFLPHGLIAPSTAIALYVGLTVAALVAASYVSITMLVLTVLLALMGVAYSAPPLRLKDRGIPALLANAVAHGSLVFLCGWQLSARSMWDGCASTLPYFFAVGAIYILTTIPDIEGDHESGKNTMAVSLGAPRAGRWALGWYWASLLMAFYTVDLLFVMAALPLAYLFVRAGAGDSLHAIRAVRWAVGALSLAACILYPWYLILLIVGFLVSRAYYKWRFDLTYP